MIAIQRMTCNILLLVVAIDPLTLKGQEKPVPFICADHLAALGASIDKNYVEDHLFRILPADAQEVGREKLPNTISTFIVAPIDGRGFSMIFSHKPSSKITQAQAAELRNIRSGLKKAFGRESGDTDLSASNYKQKIQASLATFVVLVGHNEQGAFRFLDGTSAQLGDIAGAARKDQRLLFISCNSGRLVTNGNASGMSGELNYEQAFKIASNIASYIANAKEKLSAEAVDRQLQNIEASVKFHYNVRYFLVKTGCFGAAVAVVAIIVTATDPCALPGKKYDC